MTTTTIKTSQPPTSPYLVLAVGLMAVSLAAIFIRLAQAEAVPSLVIAAGRLSVATLVVTPLIFRNVAYRTQLRQLSRHELLLAGLSGVFLAVHFAAWVTSLEYTSVLISVVLVTTTPIWAALLESFFLQAALSRAVVFGLAVALGGGVLIGLSGAGTVGIVHELLPHAFRTTFNYGSRNISDEFIGGALSAIGAITVAVYLVIGRNLRSRLALAPYIWMIYGCAALVLIFIILFTGTSVTGYSLNGYLLILALGLAPQLIGHTSFNYALAYLPATIVGVVTQAEPIGSAIIALIIFNEVPGIWQIIGSAIILAGVTTASFGQGRGNNANSADTATN